MAVSFLLLATLAASPQPAQDAVVIGRVVEAASGRPVPGAILTLNGSATGPAPLAPRVMTNGDGAFAIRGLRAGTLFLNVTKGGYVEATPGQRRPGGSGQPLQVADRQRITNVVIRMWKTAAIAGTVVDEAGEPVVGVRVQAFGRTFIAGRPRAAGGQPVTTDDRGAYRLATLLPGDYYVAVLPGEASLPAGSVDRHAADPAAMLTYSTTFFPAAPTASEAAAITVAAGEERLGADIQLRPVRALRVSGTVSGPAALAGQLPIRLARVGTSEIIPALDSAATVTRADGTFTFPAIAAGTYTLTIVQAPREPAARPDATAAVVRAGPVAVRTSAAPAVVSPVPASIPPDATLCAQTTVIVGETNVDDVPLVLRAGVRVRGRIAFDGSGDRPEDVAVANMRVVLDPADGATLPDGLSFVSGRVDENGRFTTYGVPPGRYYVRVSPLQHWSFQGAMYGGRNLADEPIDLESTDINDVVLAFTDRASSLAGIARTGQAADGTAVVLAFPVEAEAWLSTGLAPRRMRTARAASDGAYLFPTLPPGAYYVAAVREDTLSDWTDPAFLESLSRS